MHLKAIIFDLGDTLVLTDRWNYDKCLIKLQESLRQDNIVVSVPYSDFRRVYFEVRNQMYVEYEPSLREVDFLQRVARTLKRFNHNARRDDPALARAVDAFIDAFVADLHMEVYVPKLLSGLKEKYKLGLVSNFAYAPGPWKILNRFKLTEFFDTIVISGELGLRKPHPEIFNEALKGLSVKAKEAIFVGDSLKADINGAKRVGMKTVFVENIGVRKNPYAIAGELDPFPVEPDERIRALEDLPLALEAL